MSFAFYDCEVALCSGNKILFYNLKNKTKNIISIPKLEIEKEIRAHNREDIESFHTLTCVSFSDDGQYFCACVNRKQLCLFERRSLELISNRKICRAASRVRFLPSNDIVVADKSGDAYLFSTSKPNENGKLLLGHLSMLLDILVTKDQKRIISADRDEKIRVSEFPNSYNITSYCLGHKSFVTNISTIPHSLDILVSSGGDGTLKFWDYENGKEILNVDFHKLLSQDDLIQVNKSLQEYHLDECVMVSPVKNLCLLEIEKNQSILVLAFYCSTTILMYKVSKGKHDLDVEYIEKLNTEEEPLECSFYENNLWILLNTKVQIFKFIKTSFLIDKNLNAEVAELNQLWSTIHKTSVTTLLPVLFKRKFDNVQEYQERKKARLIK